MNPRLDDANEWIDTDPESCREDVERLGYLHAARHQRDLADERGFWKFTRAQMFLALRYRFPKEGDE